MLINILADLDRILMLVEEKHNAKQGWEAKKEAELSAIIAAGNLREKAYAGQPKEFFDRFAALE